MKRMVLALFALLAIAAGANAMSYEQARREALFLTDKMAYELNLTDEQYEAAYEINLDYLMDVTGRDNVFGPYWERRNLDLSYILYSWQWEAYIAANYFYRPLFWDAGYWHFGIYARYPRRDYFYFGRPHFYVTYRGGHSWRTNGGRSYYQGRLSHYRPHDNARHHHSGMRDGWDRGDYRGRANSSTRVTGDRHSVGSDRHSVGNDRHSVGNDRHSVGRSGNSTPNRSVGGSRSNPNGSLHGDRQDNVRSRSNGSGNALPSRTPSSGSRSGAVSTPRSGSVSTPRSGSVSTPRSSSMSPNRSSSVSTPRSGASMGSRSSGGSRSGGSVGSHSGGSRSGGGSFGGNRSQH